MTLDQLAAQARAEHEQAIASTRTALEHAHAAGRALIEAKRQVDHGEWLPWLKANGIPTRSAQRYMRLAGKYDDPSHLPTEATLYTALDVVAKPRLTKSQLTLQQQWQKLERAIGSRPAYTPAPTTQPTTRPSGPQRHVVARQLIEQAAATLADANETIGPEERERLRAALDQLTATVETILNTEPARANEPEPAHNNLNLTAPRPSLFDDDDKEATTEREEAATKQEKIYG